MHPRFSCFQYLLIDFRQTFVAGASWDTDDLITFLGQKVKVQGHTIAAEAHSTRRYRREHSTLPSSATFSSFISLFDLLLIAINAKIGSITCKRWWILSKKSVLL